MNLEIIDFIKSHQATQTSRIVGGELAAEGRHGYTAALFGTFDNFLCSGVLITPSLVLTSASCIDFGSNVTEVLLGCNNIVSRDACEVNQVNQVIVDENFNSTFGFGNDFAVVELAADSSQAQVNIGIDFNLLDFGEENLGNFPALVMGWGAVDPNDRDYYNYNYFGSEDLRVAEVVTTTNEQCNSQYADVLNILYADYGGYSPYIDINNLIEPSMICAESAGRGPCDGDLGGPLVLDCGSQNADVLFGIFGAQLGCGYEGIPGIYGRTSSIEFLDFLFETVQTVDARFLFIIDQDFCVQQDPNPTPFPTFNINGWTCDAFQFATRDGCHCDCGIPDPDCDFESAEVFNCGQGEVCVEGVCTLFGTEAPNVPSFAPSVNPTSSPTLIPTDSPTNIDQTNNPTVNPTSSPTLSPTDRPTNADQTNNPTVNPTASPIAVLTDSPTQRGDGGNDDANDDEEDIILGLLGVVIVLLLILICLCCVVCCMLKQQNRTPLDQVGSAVPESKAQNLVI